MMLGSGHLISGLDVATGTFALMVFSAGIAVFVLVVLARLVLHRIGSSFPGVLVVCGLALAGAVGAYVLVDRSAIYELSPDRRAIETRAAELTARSLAPGSALSCLDAVASTVVEEACEKPLFASAEAVAAAVAYVDARFSLLAGSAALADRDPGYRPVFERLLRALEADRYGLVAHVLTTRGCKGAGCPELRLLRDPTRVVANMKAHLFETSVGAHALSWHSNGPAVSVASVPPVPAPPSTTAIGTGATVPVTSGGPAAAASSKFDFPSASSIPAVSIMNAEPGLPPAAEPRPPALPPKRPATPARRHNAREAAAPAPAAPHSLPPPPAAAPAAPTPIVPEAAEEPAAPAVPDVHAR